MREENQALVGPLDTNFAFLKYYFASNYAELRQNRIWPVVSVLNGIVYGIAWHQVNLFWGVSDEKTFKTFKKGWKGNESDA